jgi:hypothetical protein
VLCGKFWLGGSRRLEKDNCVVKLTDLVPNKVTMLEIVVDDRQSHVLAVVAMLYEYSIRIRNCLKPDEESSHYC